MHNRFRPRRAAARKPSIDVDATHTGGYGLLQRTRQHRDVGHREVATFESDRRGVGLPDREHRVEVLLPDLPAQLERSPERLVLGGRRAAPGAELDPATGEDVEGGDALGDAHRVLERQQHHTVTEPDARRDARQRGEHRLGRRAVGEAAREVVLDEPHRPVADLVGEHALLDDMLEGLAFDVGRTPAHLELVRHPDLQPFIPLVRARRYPVVLKWRYGGATLRQGDNRAVRHVHAAIAPARGVDLRRHPAGSPDHRVARRARLLRGVDRRAPDRAVGAHARVRPDHGAGVAAHEGHQDLLGRVHAALLPPCRIGAPHPPVRPHGAGPLHLRRRRRLLPHRRRAARPRLHGHDEPRHDARVARDHGEDVDGARRPGVDVRRPVLDRAQLAADHGVRPAPRAVPTAASADRGRGPVTAE